MAKSNFNKGVGVIDTLFIEDPRRAIVLGIFLIVIIILLVVFWKKIKTWIEALKFKIADNQELSRHQEETGEALTLPLTKYEALANKIYNACKGWGTDEDAIYAAFNELNNTADYLKLYAVFGVGHDGHDLDWWMRDELTSWELANLNNILASKGIAKAF